MLILPYLPWFLVLVCQWIGVLSMRGRKNGAWWLMLIGGSVSTLGAALVTSFSLLPRGGRSLFGGGVDIWIIMGAVSTVGSILFAIGFAIHGLMSRSLIERQDQLESMNAAMGEELQSLRNSRL